MKISAAAAEEQSADRGQHGVARIAVQRRHRRRDSGSHDELVAGAQPFDEEGPCLGNSARQGPGFVKARHQNG